MNKAQELINAWGRKKFPNAPKDKDIRFETETRTDGYCETCWSTYAVVVVYAGYTELGELSNVAISDILNEILTSAIGDK